MWSPGPLPGSAAPSPSSGSLPEPPAPREQPHSESAAATAEGEGLAQRKSKDNRGDASIYSPGSQAVVAIQSLNQDVSGWLGGTQCRDLGLHSPTGSPTQLHSPYLAGGPGSRSGSRFSCTTASEDRCHNDPAPQRVGGEPQVQRALTSCPWCPRASPWPLPLFREGHQPFGASLRTLSRLSPQTAPRKEKL